MSTEGTKIIDKAAIDAAAKEVNITVSELVEWGILAMMNEHKKSTHSFGEAREELKNYRKCEGIIASGIINEPPFMTAAKAEGMTLAEYTELGILTAISMVKESIFPEGQPQGMIRGFREELRTLVPEICLGEVDLPAESLDRIFAEAKLWRKAESLYQEWKKLTGGKEA
jgi:hypothetical protein